jgi:hypothetical protein
MMFLAIPAWAQTSVYSNSTTGNVGIGTATPGSPLSVNGGAAFGSYGGNATAAPSNGLIISGNVGIGTATPSTALQVVGTITNTGENVNGQIATFANAGGNGLTVIGRSSDSFVWAPIALQNNSSTFEGGMAWGTGGLEIYIGSGLTTAMTILNSGSVGIDTASPGYTLQVNGSVAGTSAYVNTSDIRHKKNIQPLEVGLKEVTQLKPVTFEWKDDTLINHSFKGKVIPRPLEPAMQGKQMGFVAQDVEKILPSVVVTEGNSEKTKGMKYSELIPVLVKAIQEQQAQLTKDEAQLTRDEATIAVMKAKVGM